MPSSNPRRRSAKGSVAGPLSPARVTQRPRTAAVVPRALERGPPRALERMDDTVPPRRASFLDQPGREIERGPTPGRLENGERALHVVRVAVVEGHRHPLSRTA